MWSRVRLLQTDVSEDRAVSIFRIEEITQSRESYMVANRLTAVRSVQKTMNGPVQYVVSHCLTLFHASVISNILKMEATRLSETLVHNISTRCHIPEDGILYIVMCISVLEDGWLSGDGRTITRFR
jgi:hypothetical protein